MLEGPTLPMLFHVVLTLRQVVRGPEVASGQQVDAVLLAERKRKARTKDVQGMDRLLSKPLATSRSRCVQRHLSSGREGARAACCALPSTAVPRILYDLRA